MVQAMDARVMHEKIDAIRTGKIKVPEKDEKEVAVPSSEAVQYAALPGQFKVAARIIPSLFAQAPGARKSGICIPGLAKPKKAYRLTSTAKLNTSNLYYSLQLRSDGVDALIQQGGQLFRWPLDVKASWDARRKKVIIDGKVLKSSKIVNTVFGPRLKFDHKELGKLVKPQMDALIYEVNNGTRSSGLAGVAKVLPAIDGNLAKMKKRLGRGFKKDRNVRAMRKFLVKNHEVLKAHLLKLIKQRRRIKRLRRQKRFTSSFRKKLTALESQNAKLRSRIIALKSKLWKIIYKYWLREKRVRKRPCR